MNTMFHTATFAKKFMEASIAHCQLVGPDGGGPYAMLSNEHCVIALENVDNDYIRFEFHRPDEKEIRWELADYLDCEFATLGGAFKLRPKPPTELSNQEKFEWFLKRFDEVLIHGYLDAPLSGDYSWQARYKEAENEYKRLSHALHDLSKSGYDPDKRLRFKRLEGDLTWMDEVRLILAEQEAGKQPE